MKEESAFDAMESFTQQRRQHQQVIIVNPDVVVLQRSQYFNKLGTEGHVGTHVSRPQARIKSTSGIGVEGDEVVHHGP